MQPLASIALVISSIQQQGQNKGLRSSADVVDHVDIHSKRITAFQRAKVLNLLVYCNCL